MLVAECQVKLVGIALTKIDDRINKDFGRRRHWAAIEHANGEYRWILDELSNTAFRNFLDRSVCFIPVAGR